MLSLIVFSFIVLFTSASFCPPIVQDYNRTIPKSVIGLRPGDIGIVMAMGDSISAAFSANGKIEEYRGASFSIGGDDRYEGLIPKISPPGDPIYTLPNLLKIYNPNLKGYSEGIHGLERPGDEWQKTDHLNAAQSTAQVKHMLGQVDLSLWKADIWGLWRSK
jgi:phospholipase B1